MKCQEAVETIVQHRGRAIIVSTMSSIKHVDKLSPGGLNLACLPLMGGASTLGVGIALARPDRPVLVLDGDGCLLMQLGSLVTTIELNPKNFVHFVFNNGVWFENQANLSVPAAESLDFVALARGAGYRVAERYSERAELSAAMPRLTAGDGPSFVELVIEPEAGALWSGKNLQPDLQDFHFQRMGAEARKLREALAMEGK